jgi:DNA polymerase-3 subunit gamma/tau
MTYQALARKWRPQDFASLIGQEPVVTALRNALLDRRIAQAYLFAGIRGVGKTTAARVLAKALNCEGAGTERGTPGDGPAADPCNECRPCREIAAGADLDVQEIDAATYSKVEQVRELTESLRYGPARDRYKVVVLDEVHRLSRQAFDALLKIVEEPPPHLVFVFATTEAEAVPATLLSRCQEYRFRRVPSPVLAAHLERVCRDEGITASPAALRLLARAGEGSVRDAVALLDQLATYGGGTIADEDAARLIGSFDVDLFHRLLAAILAGDGGALATASEQVETEGWDPRQLFTRFLAYCRDALHLALGASAEQLDLPAEEAVRLQQLARDGGYENLLRLLNLLLAAEPLVRRSELAGLAVEVALLRAAELPKLQRVEALLGGGPPRPAGAPGAVAPPTVAPPAAPAGPASAPPAAPSRQAAPAPPPARAAGPAPAPAPDGGAPPTAGPPAEPLVARAASPAADLASVARPAAAPGEAVHAILQAVARRRQVLFAHLEEAEAVRLEDGELRIFQRPGDDWLRAALERAGNRAALEEAMAEVCGPGVRWRVLQGHGAPPPPATPPPAATLSVATDPTVQAVLDIFGGTIQAVEARGAQE